MSWPHEREFRGRAVIFWGLSIVALLRAHSIPMVSDYEAVVGALVAAAVSLVVFVHTRFLGRLEARFRHVHPAKFRGSYLVGFYAFTGVALGLLAAGPWLAEHDEHETPAELMAIYLAVPCLLSAAAGAYRVLDRYRLSGARSA